MYQWHYQAPKKEEITPLITYLDTKKLPKSLATLLWNRKVQTETEIEQFLNPTIQALHDPLAIYGMEKAVERIQLAVENSETILVYGDYDADGITSTTVMKEAIELIGGQVKVYIPNRFSEGYGPNVDAFAKEIESGVSLIVTVDNGVAGHEAIAYAKNQGVDVIVTDHHELPEELPNATVIIHPRHPKGNYPFGDLAGVGVAFKVACALLEDIPYEFLDLVAIGTIADLVSLTGENRTLAKIGIKLLQETDRIGLRALCKEAGLQVEKVTGENIGFIIAPRLNAIGRLGDATPGVKLMTTFDEEEAIALAQTIQKKNEERQAIVEKISCEAFQMIAEQDQHSVYVLAKEDWHEGVLGIVASKIVQKTGRPTFVLNIDSTAQTVKGSGRSVEQLNLYDALTHSSQLLTRFGGHHMAAGLTFPYENLDSLQLQLDAYVDQNNIDFSMGQPLLIDEKMEIADASVAFIQSLDLLAPFGTDNPAPNFAFSPKQVMQIKRIGATQQHLKFQLLDDQQHGLDCVAFGKGEEALELQEQDLTATFVGKLNVNEWNGLKRPQLLLVDYQISGLQVFDYRGGRAKELPRLTEATQYMVFEEKNLDLIPSYVAPEAILTPQTISNEYPLVSNLVVVDCPVEIESLRDVLIQGNYQRIYLQCASKDECYLDGMPSREQFSKLFRFISQYNNIDIRYKLKQIANFLQLKENLLIFMIEVFSELEFVTIDNGVMNQIENPKNQQLNDSQAFKRREAKIKSEEFLLFSNLTTLKDWFLKQEEKK